MTKALELFDPGAKPPASVIKKTLTDFTQLVNEKPAKYKPKHNPYSKTDYFEIGFVESQLDRMFNGLWNTEVQDVKLIANSVVVTVRLYYFNPALRIWQFKSGIGAAPLQTDRGAGATEFDKVKSDAVQKAAPSAKSYAVKNAAAQIGNAFGRHLNREFQHDFIPEAKTFTFLEDINND